MNVVFESEHGKIVNGDNVDVLKELEDNSIDSCISDFPYAIEFMGKNWDRMKHWNKGEGTHGQFQGTGYSGKRRPAFHANTAEDGIMFYDWCRERADILIDKVKPGAYVAIFGLGKTNHRMKCAFEDSGFKVVEEIDWLYCCVSEDTEILTSTGWKSYNELNDDAIVMTLNTERDVLEWQKIDAKFVYDYCGKMLSLKNVYTDQLITPNHRVLYKYKYKQMINKKLYYKTSDWIYTEARSIKPHMGVCIPVSGIYEGNTQIGENLAWLCGIILADGSYDNQTGAIHIWQTSANIDIVNKIRETLNILGLAFSEYARERTYMSKIKYLKNCMEERYVENYAHRHGDESFIEYHFYIHTNDSTIIRDMFPSIQIPMQVLEWRYEDRLALFNGLIDGDGSKKKSKVGAWAFYQKSRQFMDMFQILCFSLGFRTVPNDKKSAISISNYQTTKFQSRYFDTVCGSKVLPQIDYCGKVWCVSTQNTNFVARRNGKIFITGNSGMPKNQDIGKLYDKSVGAEREIVSEHKGHTGSAVSSHSTMFDDDDYEWAGTYYKTRPSTEFAKLWDDWKTAGLKPAHETITIFQKPMIGGYVENIMRYGVGGMNIGDCRVPLSDDELNEPEKITNRQPKDGSVFNTDSCGIDNTQNHSASASKSGRFPANIILDENIAKLVDTQTGITKSTGGSGIASTTSRARHIYGAYNQEQNENYHNDSLGGYGDSGGGSRMFPIFRYCPKVSPSERTMQDGTRNPHVTVKPVELIAWLIKLLTPKNGYTVDITAGSCTHAVACERLNNTENYNLSYLNIEIMNSEECPYCNVGAERVQTEIDSKVDTLF